MRDDFRARRREHFVVAGLIEVIVGVEERLDFGVRGQALERRHHLVAGLRSAAVDQHEAVAGGEREYIAAASVDDGQLVRQVGESPAVSAARHMRREATERSAPAAASFKNSLRCHRS